ncbi:uncharacterized protein BJ171DRAFT_496867 [Polychytrium aggregatum]|uniref:uncharacterized protein n=1 Tax=Polychytrium aggregatum TaxID=110093 RepID=UPI0022FE1A25|nr:uncharacterized protein BJ171DRAFT_496867 [Polychytrium aggregatum]KAI9206765.1 hypothetical protein BJ171DRAFT_496867 [Polychytrium aggregatum]
MSVLGSIARKWVYSSAPALRSFSSHVRQAKATTATAMSPSARMFSTGLRTPLSRPVQMQLTARFGSQRRLAHTSTSERKPFVPKSTKVASKRKTKKYKLKNNKSAVSRWLVLGSGGFKRAQAGSRHLNVKRRVWKKISKRRRVTSNATQARLLRRLIPYYQRRYMRG